MENKVIKSDTVKKNFIFQILYQFIVLGLPLVVSPYLTRTLGDTNLGIYTYTYSIAYFFVIFAMLGISKYGQRIIAARKNDYNKLRRTFWSLYSVHSIISLFSFFGFILFCMFQKENKNIYYIQAFYVLSALFDLTWLFYGLENFKSVVIKNSIIKVLETILIFTLVKNTNDIVIYTIIKSISILLGQIVLLPQVIKMIRPSKFSFDDVKEHIAPLFILSITVIASTLYTMFDKTLLGLLSTKENVAYYDYSDKIISIPKSIVSVIGTVLFPRACACFANDDREGMKKYFRYSILFTYFVSFACIFGMLSVADLFALQYYGSDFYECGKIIKSLSIVVLVVCVGDIVRTQFLIPMKKDFLFVLSLIMNAILNIVISVLLIPKMGVYGAVIGTVSAELFGTIFQIIVCKKYINFKVLLTSLVPFVLSGLLMYLTIECFKNFYNLSLYHLIFQVLIGACVYIISLVIIFLLFSPYRKDYWLFIKKIMKRRKKDLGDNCE